MRIVIISIVCILFSGCGLFRKTTKINKHLDAVSVSSDVKVSTETTTGKVDKTTERLVTSSESDDKVKVYPSPGTEVKLSPDGTVTFKADSIVSYTKRRTNQARDILKDVAETFKKTSDSLAKRDSSDIKKSETKDVDRRPSATGIFSNWIGWAVGFLIIAGGLIWFLRRK